MPGSTGHGSTRPDAKVVALDLVLGAQPERVDRQAEPPGGGDDRVESGVLAEGVFAVGQGQDGAAARLAVEQLERLGDGVVERVAPPA